ncbi:MAG: hypothetical protein FJX77_09400 [Armatimonadetes bacterium]|nr:hypothetical protein [Armatimonadota bacterium]
MDHDFLLLDRDRDGEWAPLRFIHDPRAIHLGHFFVWYIQDTLAWVPTTNPSRREPHHGLCMYGPTIIEAEGAGVAEQVFRGWAELLAIGPPRLELRGPYGWDAADHAGDDEGVSQPEAGTDGPGFDDDELVGLRVSQLEGGYDHLQFDRDELVGVLRQLVAWCREVSSGEGRFYLYHGGI